MKIAFVAQPIDPVLPPQQNSIGIWIYEVSRRLSKSHEVLVYLREKGSNGKRKTKIDGINFKFVSLYFDNRFLRFLMRFSKCFAPKKPLFATKLYYLGYILNIALNLRKQKCDIVHIHNFSQFVPIISALNPDIKIVLHMHCEWLTQLDRKMIEQRLKKTDLILSCSRYITEKTQLAFPRFKNRCFTVYNGIEVSSFTLQKKNHTGKAGDGDKRVLFIGRVSPEKGVHILLDAFGKAVNEYPELELQIIGPQKSAQKEYIVDLSDDPKVLELAPFYFKGYFKHLEEEIDSKYLDRVTFYNQIPYSALNKFYWNADLFVFPSVWNEPFGMPIIEAMACGVPVVATRGGGVPEIVEEGKTGLLVERGNADELAAAIVSLMQDRRLRESFGHSGRQFVLKRFTWDRISEDLVSAYSKLQ